MRLTDHDIVIRLDALKKNRVNWESHWQDCIKYCIPAKNAVLNKGTPGAKVATDIYDSTAIDASQILAAGLHGYLTNPSSRWFSLGLRIKELMKDVEARNWLKECEETIFDVLNASNFNQHIHETYIDFSVLGTACLYEEEDEEETVRFFARPLSEVYILENNRERVDTVYRYFSLTARQAYQKWQGKAGQKVLNLIEAKKFEEPVEFLHAVFPREERDPRKKDAINKPYASVWIELSQKQKVYEGGYDEFPFFCPRFTKLSGVVYGYSPAMIALPDIKMLNAMSKTILKAAQKKIDPPVILPDDGFLLPFNISAGAVNFKRRTAIRRAFFADMFLMLAMLDKQMTAKEVTERVNERMLILGPVLGRLMNELLDPIITRTFNILLRGGKLPPPPAILQGQEYTIEYISPLARAQKMVQIQALTELLAIIREMAETIPDVLDNIDYDKTVKEFADIYNAPEILRSDEEVRQIRQQRLQQAQTQQFLQEATQGAEAIKTISEIQK